MEGFCQDSSWPEFGSPPQCEHSVRWTAPSGDVHVGEWLGEHERDGQRVDVLKCRPCMLIHVVPLPDAAWLAHYYQQQFYQVSHPDYLARYLGDAPWWAIHHTRLLQEAAKGRLHANGHRPRLLDVGLGPSLLLDQAKRLDWETWGTECDPVLCERARANGHAVIQGTLAAAMHLPPTVRFDVLTAWEVLEHVPDPTSFLEQCFELLRPGGVLAVVVPNDYNPLQLTACVTFRLEPWWVQPPEHLYYYTPKLLHLLVERCGFDVLDMRGTYPMERFMVPEDPETAPVLYVGNDLLGRQCHAERMAWEIAQCQAKQWLAVEAQYRHNLAVHRIGREIVLLARRRAA